MSIPNWRVISVDSYARETEADQLLIAWLTEDQAKRIADIVNETEWTGGHRYCRAVGPEYRLSRGMADLV